MVLFRLEGILFINMLLIKLKAFISKLHVLKYTYIFIFVKIKK